MSVTPDLSIIASGILNQVATPTVGPLTALQLTRRSLLIGTGALVSFAGVSPVFASDDLEVIPQDQSFIINYAGRTWRLNPGVLGVSTKVSHRYRAVHIGHRHEITLDNAAWPGAAVDASLDIEIVRQGAKPWQVRLFWRAARSTFEATLYDWLDGVSGTAAYTQDTISAQLGDGGSVSFPEGSAWMLSPEWTWTLQVSPGTRSSLIGLCPGAIPTISTAQVTTIPGQAAEVADLIRASSPRYVTRLRLQGHPGEATPLISWEAPDGTEATITITDRPIDIFTSIVGSSRRAILRVDQRAVVQIGPYDRYLRRILLERAVIVGEVGGTNVNTSVAGHLSTELQTIPLNPGSITVQGDPSSPIISSFTGQPLQLQLRAKLFAGTMPVNDADLAEFEFSHENPIFVEIAIGRPISPMSSPVPSQVPEDEPGFATIRFSRQEILRDSVTLMEALFPLSNGRLRVLRAADLLSVHFRFRNISFSSTGGASYLVAHRSRDDAVSDTGPEQRSLLIVEFPPQSSIEQAFEEDNLKPLAEARLSGPTRIVFDLNLPRTDRFLSFSAYELTRWADYSMIVSGRALPGNISLTDQLGAIGIHQDTSRQQAFEKIKASLKPPTPYETLIELPAGLFMSPVREARWITSSEGEGWLPAARYGTTRGLWHVALNTRGPRPDLRFIWSPSLQTFSENLDAVPPADPFGFTTSLSEKDKLDAAILTSVFGLPALRRLTPSGSDDPNGQVLPSLPGYALVPTNRYDNEGIFVPSPITKEARITLTALGALAAFAQDWVPCRPYDVDPSVLNWRTPVSLSRIIYRQVPEGEIYVLVQEKGFLCPIGHGCSRLKITERKFRNRPDPYHNARGTGSTAYLVQREILVADRPDKTFPALNQPNQGRRFPARKVTLLTRQTPPLHAYASAQDGAMKRIDGKPAGVAFWPKLSQPTSGGQLQDVIWEYLINDDPVPVRSPLLFISNDATDSDTLRSLVRAYNATVSADVDVPRELDLTKAVYPPVDVSLRTASHGGTLRSYASSEKVNQTSFSTFSWKLAAEGRPIVNLVGGRLGDDLAAFAMDAYMNGQDQPAFYPVLESASIRVQPIEHMTGRPNIHVEVRPARAYITQGFVNNPSLSFLTVVSDGLTVDLQGNTTSGGGLANPNFAVRYLTKTGPISGPSELVPARGSSRQYGFQNAPPTLSSFFLPGAKLFGILDLSIVIPPDIKPTIVETAEAAVDDLIPILRTSVSVLLDAISQALNQLDGRVVGGGPSFGQLYPSLETRLKDLSTAVTALSNTLPQTGDKFDSSDKRYEAIKAAGQIQAGITGLLADLSSISRNPVPALAADVVQEMTQALESLRRLVGDLSASAIQDWCKANAQAVAARAIDELCGVGNSAGGPDTLNALFGDGSPDEIRTDLKWMIGVQQEVIATQIEALARVPLETLKGDACRAFYATSSGNALLVSLFGASDSQHVCDDPGGLPTAITNAASIKISARLVSIQNSLLYDAFGRFFVDFSIRVRGAVVNLVNAAKEGQEQFSQALFGLIEDMAAFAIKSGLLADLAEAVSSVAGMCDRALTAVQGFARDTMSPMNDLQQIIVGTVEPQLTVATREAASLPDPLRTTVATAIDRVRNSLNNDLIPRLTELNIEWSKLPGTAQVCGAVSAQLSPVSSVLTLRSKSLSAAKVVLDRLGAAVDILSLSSIRISATASSAVHIADAATDIGKPTRDALGKVGVALADLIRKVCSLDALAQSTPPTPVQNIQSLGNELAAGAGPLQAAGAELLAAINSARTSAQATAADLNSKVSQWQSAIAQGAGDPKTLLSLSRILVDFAAAHDRHIAALVSQTVNFEADVHRAIEAASSHLLSLLLDSVLVLYAVAEKATSVLVGQLNGSTPTGTYLRLLLKPDVATALTGSLNAIVAEHSTFDGLRTLIGSSAEVDRAKARTSALAIFGNWTESAIVVSARNFSQLADLLLRGRFDAFLDFNALSNTLEAEISNFVPTKARVDYDFMASINPFPSSDSPIFQMERQSEQDLVLTATIEVDILKGSRRVTAQGTIGPTVIYLLPSFAMMRVHLGSIAFSSTEDGGLRISNVKVTKVEPLEYLSFIQPFLSYLSGGGDSGLYYNIDPLAPSIEVGYRIPTSRIDLGEIAILNISVNLSIFLPLGNGPLTLGFSFASRQAPFLIVATPYGGGGFVAFRATPQKITSVEVSFEFGAVADISFGPLTAYGRVAAGIYISLDGDNTDLSGFVHAIGEGSLVCFSIAVLIEVGLGQKNGRAYGWSTYEFSFKIGFIELSYGFTAEYGYGGSHSRLEFHTEAELQRLRYHESAPGLGQGLAIPRLAVYATRANIPRRDTEWNLYKRHYAFLGKDLN